MNPHLTSAELAEHRWRELESDSDAASNHLARCGECRLALDEIDLVASSLAARPELDPPADGLARVLARVETVRPRAETAAVAWALAGVAASALVIGGLGQVLASRPELAGLGAATSVLVAALAFFALGSFVTLAVAPALILEARTARRPAAR